jgi:hypothetical protein
MIHECVFDVCQALLVQPVFLDGIIYKIERGMADNIRGARVACEE